MNKKFKFNISQLAYILSIFGFIFNSAIFNYFISAQVNSEFQLILFAISFIVFVFCITNITHLLILNYRFHKLIVPMTLMLNSIGFYFVKNFHILIDKNMITNLIETNINESFEYVNFTFLLYFIILGLLPTLLYFKHIAIIKEQFSVSIRSKLKHLSINLAVIFILFLGVNSLFTSYLRSHREVKHMIFPVNYLAASISKIKRITKKQDLLKITDNTSLQNIWKSISNKTVVVLILGETARAQNFSINGYRQATTPFIEKQKNLISFKEFYSCGTSTAESIPCMFSPDNKESFNPESPSENLLDVIMKAGFKVTWVENNSGCKGVCDRTNFIQTKGYDYEMINLLPKLIEDPMNNKIFIVLHQLGSHGPSYYKRYPKEFGTFHPTCDSDQLYNCSQEEITNTYDNTILVTDKLIADTITILNKYNNINSSLVYVSDHGESLGENNLYLHGIPYWIAPKEQKHIPFIFWSSTNFHEKFKINFQCLFQKKESVLTHDNFFHSILGMLKIKNNYYQGGYDVFKNCKNLAYQKRPSIK